MDNGWIKLHRKIQAKGYYKNSQYVHLWIHLLLLANHSKHEYMHDGGIIHIKEGQLITGRKQLSEATGISETTVERILKLLENEHQIGQKKTTKYRVITILNWEQHQSRTEERTTNGQQTDTYKNDKNDKNLGATAPLRVRVPDTDTPKKKENTKHNSARISFSWLPNRQESWDKDLTQLSCGYLLFKRGEEAVRQFVKYVQAHQDDDGFNWTFVKPSDYERKWEDIKAYAKRNR